MLSAKYSFKAETELKPEFGSRSNQATGSVRFWKKGLSYVELGCAKKMEKMHVYVGHRNMIHQNLAPNHYRSSRRYHT